jgi:ATP-binding cassette subfamily B protein
MDPVREAMLYKLFQEEFKGQIGICITHRMGAAKMCDEIIVLSGGKVAESGSHEILMARNGLYHSMYCEQRSWYE